MTKRSAFVNRKITKIVFQGCTSPILQQQHSHLCMPFTTDKIRNFPMRQEYHASWIGVCPCLFRKLISSDFFSSRKTRRHSTFPFDAIKWSAWVVSRIGNYWYHYQIRRHNLDQFPEHHTTVKPWVSACHLQKQHITAKECIQLPRLELWDLHPSGKAKTPTPHFLAKLHSVVLWSSFSVQCINNQSIDIVACTTWTSWSSSEMGMSDWSWREYGLFSCCLFESFMSWASILAPCCNKMAHVSTTLMKVKQISKMHSHLPHFCPQKKQQCEEVFVFFDSLHWHWLLWKEVFLRLC